MIIDYFQGHLFTAKRESKALENGSMLPLATSQRMKMNNPKLVAAAVQRPPAEPGTSTAQIDCQENLNEYVDRIGISFVTTDLFSELSKWRTWIK